MKICHIIIGLNIGGAELMLNRLIQAHHDDANYQHMVISLTDIGDAGRPLQCLGVDVKALGMKSFLDTPRVLWQLMKIINSNHPDIIQTWMYHADLLGGLASRLIGNNHVIWGIRTTNISTDGSHATLFVRRLCAWLSHWIPHTIVCAAEASRKVHVALGYDAARMVVVPNGFDLARFVSTLEVRNNLRIQFGFDEESLVIGSLGRFDPDKAQMNFVSAAGLLAKRHTNAYFLMVGRNLDNSNSVLRRWIQDTGYEGRFVLLGERSDVPAILSAMDIFCLHSRTEGFPNVLGEAMAMGLPSVATDVGDAALLLGGLGVIVQKEDSQALALGLEKILELTPDERAVLGQKSKRRIRSEFLMENTVEHFEMIYGSVLKGDVK